MPSSFLSSVLLVVTAVAAAVGGAAAIGGTADPLEYYGGHLLTGELDIGILWYGNVTKTQKHKVVAFLKSISGKVKSPEPTVASWWKIIEGYQTAANLPAAPIKVKVVAQVDDSSYSLGRVLVKTMLQSLITATTETKPNIVAIIVASHGVSVHHMCAGDCWQHGSLDVDGDDHAFVAVGNPEKECPVCAWPFAKDPSHPNSPVLKPPSGNIGADAMVMSVAAGLAGAVTNPYGDGFYSQYKGDDIDATAMCKGIFGSGSTPGFPGNLLVDSKFGGSYNVHGIGRHKFLVPAIWDPHTDSCWTPT